MDGNDLKNLRIEKGLSLTKLSRETGISKSYLSLLERNIQKNPSLEILKKIGNSLGVEMEDLIKGQQDTQRSNIPESLPVKTTLKLEIELSEEQLTSQNLEQLRELLKALSFDSNST
jgi:transcriptional regulator with XRE-family HTH domain